MNERYVIAALLCALGCAGAHAQERRVILGDQKPLYEDAASAYIDRPLLPYQQSYARIDGKHLLGYVQEITAIARRDRDRGTQMWGRLTGKQGDAESAQWVAAQFRRIGLSDVKIQDLDVPPVWSHDSWDFEVSQGGQTVKLAAAVPLSEFALKEQNVPLPLVYAGLGTGADFIGRDVQGKVVVIYEPAPPGNRSVTAGAIERAVSGGAIAMLRIMGIPGNVKVYSNPSRAAANKLFEINVGSTDGDAIRKLLESASSGAPATVRMRYSGKLESGLKTANVWGVLPGTSDEKILIIGHRNSWFEGSVDNAAGEATMLGLAEYFAAIPKQQRRRTLVFVASPGHHRGGALGTEWIAKHPESVGFDKVALTINAEHTARVESYLYDFGGVKRQLVYPNQAGAYYWYVGGSAGLKSIVGKAFKDFGIAVYNNQFHTAGDAGPVLPLAPGVQIIDAYTFFHTDGESDDKVPFTGLQNITRAYAYVIDEVNKRERKELVWLKAGE